MSTNRALLSLLLLLFLPALACTISSPQPTAGPTLLATAALPAPTASPAGAELVQYQDDALGISLAYPAGWSRQSFPGFLTLATNESLLNGGGYSEDGAVIVIASGQTPAVAQVTDAAALQAALGELNGAADLSILEGPTTTTLNGQPAVTAIVAGTDEASGAPVIFYVTLIENEAQAVLIAGTTLQQNEARFRPVFMAVSQSVVVSTPAGISNSPTPTPAGNLTYGTTISGTIPAGGATAWRFDGQAGDILNITAEPGSSGLDLTLDVRNSAGSTILPNGTVDDSFSTEFISGLILPADGPYTVVLSGFLGSGGDFLLTVESADDDAPALRPGSVVTGSLAASDENFFQLSGTAGVTATLVLLPDESLDALLEVYDLDGTRLLAADSGFSGESELAVFVPPRDGRYQLRVAEFAGEGSGGYVLGVATNDSALIADANSVDQGTSVDYTLRLDAGETILVVARPEATFDVVARLYDQTNALLGEADAGAEGAAEVLAFTAPAGESSEYTLRLSGFDDSAGSYALLVMGGQPATSPAASDLPVAPAGAPRTILAPGAVVEATLEANASDSYTFPGRAGETSAFYLFPDPTLDLVLVIRDGNGSELARVDDGFAGGGELLDFVPPRNGEYLLEVVPFVGSGGSYLLGMVDEAAALVADSDTVGNDTAISYTLNVPAGERRAIMVFPDSAFDVIVLIFDRNDSLVAESDNGITGKPEALLFQPEQGGEYVVRIRGFVNVGGSYTIRIITV